MTTSDFSLIRNSIIVTRFTYIGKHGNTERNLTIVKNFTETQEHHTRNVYIFRQSFPISDMFGLLFFKQDKRIALQYSNQGRVP